MNRILLVFFGLLFLASCSTTKTTSSRKLSPVGEWDYSITDTPQGDFSGIMTVSEQDKIYSAKLNANGGDLPFEKFTFDKESKKAGGELDYAGTLVYFDALVTANEMVGIMSTGGMEFPFKATRKSK